MYTYREANRIEKIELKTPGRPCMLKLHRPSSIPYRLRNGVRYSMQNFVISAPKKPKTKKTI